MSETWKDDAAVRKDLILSKFSTELIIDPILLQIYRKLRPIDVINDSKIFAERELEITKILEVRQLAHKIAEGYYTAVEVLKAFIKRAAFSYQLVSHLTTDLIFKVNCLTEVFFEEALKQAADLDEYYKTYKTTKGLLHGIPISLKVIEQFCYVFSNITGSISC